MIRVINVTEAEGRGYYNKGTQTSIVEVDKKEVLKFTHPPNILVNEMFNIITSEFTKRGCNGINKC